jgi:hypothetical protein
MAQRQLLIRGTDTNCVSTGARCDMKDFKWLVAITLFLADPIFNEEVISLLAPNTAFFHCHHFISRFVAFFFLIFR